MAAPLRTRKPETGTIKTIGDIVATIAAEHGLTPKVAAQFKGITFEYLAQKAESDINFLTRIGKDHDAIVAIKELPDKGRSLLFIGKGEGKSASGRVLQKTQIFKSQLLTGARVTKSKATAYRSVKAIWHNKETGEKEAVTVGEGSPVFEITHPHGSKDAALNAAKAKLGEQTRVGHSMSMALIGTPTLRAEGQITIIGLRPSIPPTWSIKTVAHRLEASGYTTQIECELPKP